MSLHGTEENNMGSQRALMFPVKLQAAPVHSSKSSTTISNGFQFCGVGGVSRESHSLKLRRSALPRLQHTVRYRGSVTRWPHKFSSLGSASRLTSGWTVLLPCIIEIDFPDFVVETTQLKSLSLLLTTEERESHRKRINTPVPTFRYGCFRVIINNAFLKFLL